MPIVGADHRRPPPNGDAVEPTPTARTWMRACHSAASGDSTRLTDSLPILEADHHNPPPRESLPSALLYAIAAPVGGHGLGTTAAFSLRPSAEAGILKGVVAVSADRRWTGAARVRSLAWHPVRLARAALGPEASMQARKQIVARKAARWLGGGSFDCFHGWSGEALDALLAARRRGCPALLDIPTWHRDKGLRKPFYTQADRERRAPWFEVTRQQVLTEYALADLVLVQSRAAAESFLDAGFPGGKLFLLGRGVDAARFRPAARPDLFRLVFVGTLCRRKGVHLLLEAWRKLALRDAELVLVGGVGDDIKTDLRADLPAGIRLVGFDPDPQRWLGQASAFVLPSSLEGAAKAVYEAAACGLPLIATRASGDVVVDGLNGIVIPPDNPDALADAIRALHADPDRAAALGQASRRLVEERFTWQHHANRLLHAYAHARRLAGG